MKSPGLLLLLMLRLSSVSSLPTTTATSMASISTFHSLILSHCFVCFANAWYSPIALTRRVRDLASATAKNSNTSPTTTKTDTKPAGVTDDKSDDNAMESDEGTSPEGDDNTMESDDGKTPENDDTHTAASSVSLDSQGDKTSSSILLPNSDAVENSTDFFPPEKEQPDSWPVTVGLIFFILALILCIVAAVRACQSSMGKRHNYEEIESLVV
jgi:hypothetical protein